VASRATVPELLLLKFLVGEEVSEERLTLPWTPGNEGLLAQLRQQISKAMGTLSYRERGILEMRFGFGDGWAYTLAEAGEVFKLTRERIRQLQGKALKKLKKRNPDLLALVHSLGAPRASEPLDEHSNNSR